ncbi:uncharacterized protein LOC119675408 [Teleopsis dalmanni]|uniref:uncharacterized protein LOC119675408 n=1 Tax=Teleopsis dalmanni TaxID=139649 RepID=UPI0018CCA98A|nr:uncharacterized protein LOC119675408 [Teleopsis dalmanni]
MPTFITKNRQEVLDVTLATARLHESVKNWKVSTQHSFSDHMILEFTLTLDESNICNQKTFRNVKNTNWTNYNAALSELLLTTSSDPPGNTFDLDNQVQDLTSVLNEAFSYACPLTQPSRKCNPPWWNKHLGLLRKEFPPQPGCSYDISKWKVPNSIQLADPTFFQQGKIDILLGAEFYFSLLKKGKLTLAPGLPVLQNSTLGWIVSGKVASNTDTSNVLCAVFGGGAEVVDNNSSLENAIERLWRMDDVNTTERTLSKEEKLCESHFVQNVHTNKEGRFVVRLPFLENSLTLGESQETAWRRFISLERRLRKNDVLRKQYVQFMEEYDRVGHMTEVNLNPMLTPRYFIPHHCILKPDSTTTKLRVVFDASAETGHSLNDLMYNGPTVQSELFSILLRFRRPRFVFTTDIEKMYLQVLINPEDRRYQLIIWRSSLNSTNHYYQLNTITYGTRAASYLATRCLQKIALENKVNYPLGAQILCDNFYVDDGLGGSDSLITAIEAQRQLIHILKKHQFYLRKWSANHPQLLKNISQDHQVVNLDFTNDNNESIKTLGLFWLPKADLFGIKVKMEGIITKRVVSSDLGRLFDPLGLLAPVIVKAKIFIQHLWQLKLSWDEPLPTDLCTTWSTFRENLSTLENLQVARHIFRGEVPSSTQLHIFADASEKAFGAAAYVRAILKDGRIIVRLLCAKSRVAPLKKQTLPRLELCAAVLAAELSARVKSDLQEKDQPVFLWTDSEIVLSWVNSQSSSFQTFVANRVARIQTLTLSEQWRHVRSKDNPADVLSRGLLAKALSTCALWFQGPFFLHGRQETLQKIVAYVLRFTNNARKSKESRATHIVLSANELDAALITIICHIQGNDFHEEIKQLKKQGHVDKSSSISSLSPFIDNANVLRVGGRLEASSLPYDSKHPMLIPYNDPLAKLLFVMFHEENKHCGPQALLSIVRQRFWPIKGKSTARATVQRCIRCNKARLQLCQQIMGNLPESRITPARPFINAGVDYCGPFWIHYKVRGKKPTKAYIAVFCCFSTKAVHLELVTDLSTNAFIGALKRFISRRGRCLNIYSDNATNFVGAKNQLAELEESIYSNEGQEAIISACSTTGINFHFIPPRAPHFGGLWEASVKSAKYLLLRSVSTASLTYEELETVVMEIEAILNARPLIPMSNDPTDLTALTPGHLLIGEALTTHVDSRLKPKKHTLLSRWNLVSQLKHNFWKRWSNEYLMELQQRNKWKTQSANIQLGDMVIIKEDNVPVMQWPLGRIVHVYKGTDGHIRVADVKTSAGIFKRPIHRLAILPVNTDDQPTMAEADHEVPPDNLIMKDRKESYEEPKIKRRKLPTNLYCSVLLTLLLILPIVIGSPIDNKRFGTKLGIHFENLGTTAISTTEWNLLVYYDLSLYWTEAAALNTGIMSLHQACQQMKPNALCANTVNHFKHIESELQLNDKLLHDHRFKRGAIDLVGNIAHSLFGVLDSEYVKGMSNIITEVKQNEI